MKRFFVQLAHKYKSQDVGGWLMSEKLDGMRAYWDGGVTRGRPTASVPWANSIVQARITPPVSTGLWSRGGKMIPAPDEWLDALPDHPLDGELYLGKGQFQAVMSICKGADNDWSDVQYAVYGVPSIAIQFSPGEMCFNAKEKIVLGIGGIMCFTKTDEIQKKYLGMKLAQVAELEGNDVWYTVKQTKLPLRSVDYEQVIADNVMRVTSEGGEGLMLANPYAAWEPHRSHNLLKVKTFEEGEGEVNGYVWGRETDRGSKLAGLMGQLRVRYNGREFGLSGFTDAERVLTAGLEAWEPGEPVDASIHSEVFPIGSMVRFKFRELTDDGLPKEARYWR